MYVNMQEMKNRGSYNVERCNPLHAIIRSWGIKDGGLEDTQSLLEWIRQRNRETHVSIFKNKLEDSTSWFYDAEEGVIRTQNRSFFSICGLIMRGGEWEQPIILQEEIGYLGILCKEFDGIMYFLMQAKIEPGNVNKIQISPTIQATKSNFTQKHGGAQPAYLDYFLHAEQHQIIIDQIQSEQSSRFWKKRNRNIIVCVQEEVPLLPTHRWMTLGQIKALMRYDNLVNMDTRTVLSCIPFSQYCIQEEGEERSFKDRGLYRSVFYGDGKNHLPEIYRVVNNCKMFDETGYQLVPLTALQSWHMEDNEFVCDHPWPFKVIFCDISIEGREVRHWTQPLFEARGSATFGLLMCEENGVLKFIVRPRVEPGCFDKVELGPTVQYEAGAAPAQDNVSLLLMKKLKQSRDVIFDTMLSEEGGRFYHEQNRNVLIRVSPEELGELPQDCFLVDYRTLNQLIQVNNTVNIQLRNLLSLLEVG